MTMTDQTLLPFGLLRRRSKWRMPRARVVRSQVESWTCRGERCFAPTKSMLQSTRHVFSVSKFLVLPSQSPTVAGRARESATAVLHDVNRCYPICLVNVVCRLNSLPGRADRRSVQCTTLSKHSHGTRAYKAQVPVVLYVTWLMSWFLFLGRTKNRFPSSSMLTKLPSFGKNKGPPQ